MAEARSESTRLSEQLVKYILDSISVILSNEANVSKIEYMAQTPGGWEGWLQCELAFCLYERHRLVFLREVRVWKCAFVDRPIRSPLDDKTKEKCDLYYEQHYKEFSTDLKLVVELKCLGLNRVANSDARKEFFQFPDSSISSFLKGVQNDKTKVDRYFRQQGQKTTDTGLSIVVIPIYAEKYVAEITDKLFVEQYKCIEIESSSGDRPGYRILYYHALVPRSEAKIRDRSRSAPLKDSKKSRSSFFQFQ